MTYTLLLKTYSLNTKQGKPKKEVNLLIPKTLKTTCRHCEKSIAWGKAKGKEKAYPVEETPGGEFVPHLCPSPKSPLYWNA